MATLLAALVLATGCITSTPMPSVSFSKFVRDPQKEEGATGKLGFSTGTVIQKRQADDHWFVYSFPLEGAVSGWITERFDMTFSLSSGLNYDGNIALYAGDRFRFGILHGLSFGFWESKYFEDALVGLSIGLFFQYGAAGYGALFGGFSYLLAIPDTARGELGEEKTHYFKGSLGYMFMLGRFRLALELVHSYRYLPGEHEESQNRQFFFPMATFAATY
jgi:hypothetical protein